MILNPGIVNSCRLFFSRFELTNVSFLNQCARRWKYQQKLLLRTAIFGLLLLAPCVSSVEAQTNTFPADGNVGIGTTSPTVKVQTVVNSANTDNVNVQAADIGLAVGNSNSTANNLSVISFLNSWPAGQAQIGVVNLGTNALSGGHLFFNTRAAGGGFAERMRITSAGYLGIGTTSPDSKLMVNLNTGAVASPIAGTNLHIAGADSASNRITLDAFASFNSLGFQRANGTSASKTAVAANDILGLVYGAGFDGTSAYGLGAQIRFNASQNFTTSNQGTYLVFGTSANNTTAFAERVRIDNAGNVGIGTTTPTKTLDVAGEIRSTGGFRFSDGTLQSTASFGTINNVTAGSGLTGGGTTGAITLDINTGAGLSVVSDSISVNYGSTPGTAVEGNKAIFITTNTDSGLEGGGSLTLGSGGTLTLANNDRGSSQFIFKNVANVAGTTQFSAGDNDDSIRFGGTGGTSVTFNVAEKKITVDSSSIVSSQWNPNGSSNIDYTAGNVGIGTSSLTPGYRLDVNGNTNVTGDINLTGTINARYQDVAEWVPSTQVLSAGTVVTLDPTKSNHVEASSKAYDTRVAGVISAQPGIALGEQGKNKVLVATTGRVRIKVDASHGPIEVGDLLVSSNVPGVAMKSKPIDVGGVEIHRPGTLIGKALEPLAKGRGEILVLLSLQ